jgi:hypothetical protein
MPRRSFPKICFERILEGQQLAEANRLAWRERFENQPLFPAVPMPFATPMPEPFSMALDTRKLWQPGRLLHVHFLEGEEVVKTKVEQIAHTWEQFANVKFVFGDDPEAEIRISFTHDPGSWSYLGTDALTIPQGQPTMNYGWLHPNTQNLEYNRVVTHEFGHALGCIHEHQNPAANIPWNKPAVYRYYGGTPNFWPPAKVDVNLFQKYSETITQFSAFDTQSIMLYPISKDLTDGVFEVGWNTELSQTDKDFIASIYPPTPKQGVELFVDAAPAAASIGAHGEEDLYRFNVASPGTFTIETSGSTDVLIGLFGPDDLNLALASDDDSGPGLNARLQKLLQTGDYYLRVRHYRPQGTGNYSISVVRVV